MIYTATNIVEVQNLHDADKWIIFRTNCRRNNNIIKIPHNGKITLTKLVRQNWKRRFYL
jgi:hypothetical protein